MDLLEFSETLPLLAAPHGIEIIPRRGGLWRVARTDGVVLGYVERITEEGGTRFRAKRMLLRAAGFSIVGEFWSADDAVEALRA